jgi:hypothetical protein
MEDLNKGREIQVEALVASVIQHARHFRPLDSNPSYVGFI